MVSSILCFVVDLDSVLQRPHEIDGYKLEISDKSFKPVPKKRAKASTPKAKVT